MAFFATEAGNDPEAVPHLGHGIELTQGEHRAHMQEAQRLLEEGDLHEVAHLIAEMLTGLEPTELEEPVVHLGLAFSSAHVGEQASAIHHLEHFLEVSAGSTHDQGGSVLTMLRDGHLH